MFLFHINVPLSRSLSISLCLSLKSMSMSLGEDIKKKKKRKASLEYLGIIVASAVTTWQEKRLFQFEWIWDIVLSE